MLFRLLVAPLALVLFAIQTTAMDRAAAALRIAKDLRIPHSSDPKSLYALFPSVFPGEYNGKIDMSLYNHEATFENVLVAVVRWTGWDTVHYNNRLLPTVEPYVSPEGFPFYKPDPTPRSIPYVIVALQHGLINRGDLPKLRSPVTNEQIDALCRRVRTATNSQPVKLPLILDQKGIRDLKTGAPDPHRLLIIPQGFNRYDLVHSLPNPFLDLNSPEMRLFNGSSALANGKQDYFPLGPLDSEFSVGLHVPKDSFSHQAESIYGMIENDSTTVNAVGIWGSATSLRKGARVWGGFIKAESGVGKNKDAQVIGLEIDTINNALPGIYPNESKVGVQIVGVGPQPVTNALEVIGAGPAKWQNALLIDPNALAPGGAVIGMGKSRVARGIDFSNTQFTDFALGLAEGARVTFRNHSGSPSALYTDSFGNGHFVIRAAPDGLRIASNDDSRNLMVVDRTGNILTPKGNFDQVVQDVAALKRRLVQHVPATSHDRCKKGDMAENQKFLYVCVAKDQWRRTELSDW